MATRFSPAPLEADYDGDFALWAEQQAEHLRAGRFQALDIENIAEEIESLARSDKRSVASRFEQINAHLLKLALSTDAPPRADWWHTVRRKRDKIEQLLEESPSLRPQAPVLAVRFWRSAVREAQHGLRTAEADRIPQAPPFTAEQLMTIDDDATLAALLPR